ncbi:hypothetical protein HDU67_008312 [Dinochytrium kinnereticum]|nr:hypothetical protein HDU67_008312 [Dinochytrium kinnereticum]
MSPPAQHGGAQYMPVAAAMPYAPVVENSSKALAEKMPLSGNLFFNNTMSNVPVFDWTPEIVAGWISSKGFPSYIADTLFGQGVDGTRLLLLTDSQLQQMGIISPEVCQSIRSCVDALREQSSESAVAPSGSGGGDVPPPYVNDVGKEGQERLVDLKRPGFNQ